MHAFLFLPYIKRNSAREFFLIPFVEFHSKTYQNPYSAHNCFYFSRYYESKSGQQIHSPWICCPDLRRRSFSPLLCRLILLYALTHHGLFTIFNPYLYLLLLIFQTLSNAVSRIHVPGQYCSHTYSRPYPLNRTPACIQHPEVLLGHPGT